MKGIDQADSFTWNPHKMVGVPQQCSLCIVNPKHGNILKRAHSANATYLFQVDKENAEYDTGDSTIQCGRRVDILKFWMMWKAIGNQGMEKKVDHAFGISEYLRDAILKRSDRFRLVNVPMCTNVCFYYVVPSLRKHLTEKDLNNDNAFNNNEDFRQKLHATAPLIKKKMQEKGSMMCGFQIQGDLVNFWRMVVMNPSLTTSDMDWVLDEIERIGEEIDCF